MLVHAPVSLPFPLSPHATKPSPLPPPSGGVVHFPDPDVDAHSAAASAPSATKPDIDKLLTTARPLIPHPIAFQPAQREANAKPRHTFPPLTSTPPSSTASTTPSSSTTPSPIKRQPLQFNGTHTVNGHSRPHPLPNSSPKLSPSPLTPPTPTPDDSALSLPVFTLFPPASLTPLSRFPPSITRPGVGLHNLGNSCAHTSHTRNTARTTRCPSSMRLRPHSPSPVCLLSRCFLNSCLQALIHTPLLASYALTRAHSRRCQVKLCPPAPAPAPPTLAFGSRDWHPPSLLGSPPSAPLLPFCLFCAVEDVIVRSLTGTTHPFAPHSIFNRLPSISRSLKRGRQEDAHEFLRLAFDALQSQALAMDLPPPPPPVKGSEVGGEAKSGAGGNGPLPKGSQVPASLFASLQPAQLHRVKETSILYQIYAGYYRSTLTCRQCQRPSHTFEPFLDLSLSIPRLPHSSPSTSYSSSYSSYSTPYSRFPSFGLNHWTPRPPPPPQPPLTLHQCLALFTSDEHLDASNMYRCATCKCRTKASKRLTIHRAPNVLVVHLKRFEHGRGEGGGEKIMRMVTFEQQLDLRPYMSEKEGGEVGYDLYAVLVHQGSTMMHGHYYSYVKAANGRWYQMNDESVREVEVREVLQQKAYILFYAKKKVEGQEAATAKEPTKKEAVNGKAKEEASKPKAQAQLGRFKQLVADLQEAESKEAPRTPAAKATNGAKAANGMTPHAEQRSSDDSDEDDEKDRNGQQPSDKKPAPAPVAERREVFDEKREVVEEKAPAVTVTLAASPSPVMMSPSKPLTLAAIGPLSPMSSPPPSPQSAARKRKFVVTSTPSSAVPPTMPSFQRGSMQKFNAYAGSGKRMKRSEPVLQLVTKLVDYSSSSSDDDDEQSHSNATHHAPSAAGGVEEKTGTAEAQEKTKEESKEETKEATEAVGGADDGASRTEASSPPPTKPSSPSSPSLHGKRALEEKDANEDEGRKRRRLVYESHLTTTSVSVHTPSSSVAKDSAPVPPSSSAEPTAIRFDPHAHRHAAHSQYSTVIPSWENDASHEREQAEALRKLEAERRPREKDEYDREYDRGRERKVRGKREELQGAAVSGGENLLQRELEERTERKREEEKGGRDPSRDGGRDRGRDADQRRSSHGERRHRGDGDGERDHRHSHRSHSSRHHSSHHRSRHSYGSRHEHGEDDEEGRSGSRGGHRHPEDRRHSDFSHRHHEDRSERR